MEEKNRPFPKTVSIIVAGEEQARIMALQLLNKTVRFEIEPLPEGKFSLTVPAERQGLLDWLSNRAETEFVQMVSTYDEASAQYTAPDQAVHVAVGGESVVIDLSKPGVRWQDGPRVFLERRSDHWRTYVHTDAGDARGLVVIHDHGGIDLEPLD
jgi:tRNA(Ser,Leu) C12 N-acetylase TAN1